MIAHHAREYGTPAFSTLLLGARVALIDAGAVYHGTIVQLTSSGTAFIVLNDKDGKIVQRALTKLFLEQDPETLATIDPYRQESR